jgi:hypothetical protein
MKTSPIFSALILAGITALSAHAQLVSLDFDSATGSPALASQFDTARFSFHNAVYAPDVDEFGDTIPGSEHWQIDAAADMFTPLTIENPSLEEWGRGNAPSEPFALQAVFAPVLVSFDHAYRLSAFNVVLDADTFGTDGVTIDFLSDKTITHRITLDQSIPLFEGSLELAENVTGFVLPSGAFYDNLSFTMTPVPEASTWAAGSALFAVAGLSLWRRRRSVSIAR